MQEKQNGRCCPRRLVRLGEGVDDLIKDMEEYQQQQSVNRDDEHHRQDLLRTWFRCSRNKNTSATLAIAQRQALCLRDMVEIAKRECSS